MSGLRRVVKRTEKDKETAYALLGQMKKQLIDRRQTLEDVIARKRELVEKKREILDTKYTAEEKIGRASCREIALNSELKVLSEKMYKITQEIFDCKAKEKNLEADINGSIVTLNNLQAKTNRLDHEALKQQEVLYHQVNRFFKPKDDNSNVCLFRRISKFNRSNDESIECKERRALKNKRY